MDGLNGPVSDVAIKHSRLASRPMPRPPRRWRRVLRWIPFFLFVILPTVAAGVYLFGYAADQYVSEAKFVVRGASGGPQPGVLSTLLQGVGMSRAQDDTFAVQDYILSRDALTELNKSMDVRAIFARPEADVLSRFPWPYFGNSFEHLYKHFLTKVEVAYDSTTGVTQLTVKAFRPEDAAAMANALLTGGESLVNRMNERQRQNTMRDAGRDVADAEVRVQKVAADLASYRNRAALLDPNKQSATMLQAVADMQSRVTLANTQLGELMKTSPQSPLIEALKRRIAVMQSQIDEARSLVTGSDKSMVPQITEFDALTLQREFADRQLSSAVTFFDTARMTAERQDLYLDAIVKPNEADYPLYPKRFVDLAIVFATCFGAYTIAKLMIAGAREHRTL